MAFHVDWFSGHIPVWQKILKKFKNKPNLQFLEIGCYEGKATLWLCQNILTHPSSKIFVIDTFKGSMEHSKEDVRNLFNDFQENLSPYINPDINKSKIIINKGLSGRILKEMDQKNKFDFIYVDGSQTAKNVLEDTILSWALLKRGGRMVLNDYGWRLYENPILRPDPAINAFLRIFDGQYEVLHVGYQVAILKKGDNVPVPKTVKKPKNPYPWQEEDNGLRDEINRLQEIAKRLTNDLKKIQRSKAYKIWQGYCNYRDFLKALLSKTLDILK